MIWGKRRFEVKLGLGRMARSFTELQDNQSAAGLGHAEWLALLLDCEATEPSNRQLIAGDWIDAPPNLIIEGPTGVGKSWLARTLGSKTCRDNRSVLYQRVPKLFPISRSPAATGAIHD